MPSLTTARSRPARAGRLLAGLLALASILLPPAALAEPTPRQAAPEPVREAEPEYVEGIVLRELGSLDARQLEVRLDDGQVVIMDSAGSPFAPGDRIEVFRTTAGDDQQLVYYPSDYVRRAPLLWLAILFVVVATVVGKGKGLRAVLGMAFSLAVILVGIVPAIVGGWNPALVAILGSTAILAASVYFVHGINWTTSAALVGTVFAAGVALGLGAAFASLARLTGAGSEEALFIRQLGANVNLGGLLIAGMIVGSLGALVDSTIAQAAVVRELAALDPKASFWRLYAGGMGVGFDHIASLVNTLVLAYAGASLPLFVLFNVGGADLGRVLNLELVATEIVQALVGSIALILAVPISTLLAAWLFAGNRRPDASGAHHHHHGHAH